MKPKDCEYAIAVKWSDVVYKCENLDKCEFELKRTEAKYCMLKEKKE